MSQQNAIDEYIQAAPAEVREKLHQLRACILAAAPDATESLKWGMPAFSSHRILVTFRAFKNHIGFYPTHSAISAFAQELTEYKTGKDSIQFPHEKALPLPLIAEITAFRVREVLEEGGRWRS